MTIGTAIQVAYDPIDPSDFQIMRWQESPVVLVIVLFGFMAFLLLFQMIGIAGGGDSTFDDPFHILPKVVANFKSLPYLALGGFVVLLIMVCGATTYSISKQAYVLVNTGVRAKGVVIFAQENTRVSLNGKQTTSYPMIQFKDKDNVEHVIKRSLASPYSRLEIGDEVDVIYPAKYPDSAVVYTWDELYLIPLVFGLFGLAFLLLAFFFIRRWIELN
jgi:hypothetical protein